jgi:hypothetical protein
MVAEKDPLASMVSRAASEECVAQVSCSHFERKLLFDGVLPDVRFTQLEFQAQLPGGGASQKRIGPGGRTAEMMVQMTDHQFPVSKKM